MSSATYFLPDATWIKIPSHIWSRITLHAKRFFLKRVQDATLALLSTFKNQCLDLLKKKVFNLENI